MPKNPYFGHPPSPNFIIVPTENFHPPPPTGWEQIADPITSSPSINCEQISPVNYNIHPSPYVSNCNQQNYKCVNAEVFFNSNSTPEFPEKFQNPPLLYQNSILTQASSSNMSQSIQELSTYKYKSRNNLVDLTGFNLLKRDSASSLAKRQDLKQIDDNKVEPDKIKTSSEKELRHCSDSDTCKTDNIKEFAKNMKPMITDDQRNPENYANGKPKENTKGDIKKYVREVWKRSFEKFQEKVAKDKLSGVIKSSSTKKKQDSKESKHESSKSKAHLQTSSKRKSTSTKDLDKITEGSKKYRNLERRIVDKYPKSSKTEKNSRNLKYSKVSIRDREIDSSPDAKRHYDDLEIKCKRQLKTKSLPREKIGIESRETTNIKRKIDVKKKIDELKQYIKSDKHSKVSTIQTTLKKDNNYTYIGKPIDQANKGKALVKSFVRGDRNLSNNFSQKVNVEGVQDLRPKINKSHKRSRSESFVHNQEPLEKRLDWKSLVISVKQDVEAGSENSATLAPPFDEPKAKKYKPIELIKNIKCPVSDSGDIDQNPPEDLSFLDDLIIHADEIVASLPRSSQFEHSLCSSLQMITTDNTKSGLIKKINGSKDNEEANLKKSLIIDHNMESLETNKTKGKYSKNNEEQTEDRNNYDSTKAIAMMQREGKTVHNSPENNETLINNIKVKEKELDTCVDKNLGIGSIANTKKNKHVKNINQNTKNEINSQDEENNKIDMTEKVYGEIRLKEAMRLCKDKQTIIITITAVKTKKDSITIKDLTEKAYGENASKETRSLCMAKEMIVSNSKYDINTNQEGKKLTDLTENDYEKIGLKETMSYCTANEIMSICKPSGIIITNSKYEKQTEKTNNMTALTEKDYEQNASNETKSACQVNEIIESNSKYEKQTTEQPNNVAAEEIAPKETTSLCKAKEILITNSKCDINTNQKGKEITDLIGNDYKENAPKETMSFCTASEIMTLCKASEIIITNSKYEKETEGTNIMAALTGKDNEEIAPKETSLCKASKVIIMNSKYDKQTTEQPNNMVSLIGKDKEIAPKETASLFKDKEIITHSKCEINTNQEGKEIIGLIGNDHKEIAPNEIRRLCKSKRTKIKTHSKHERNTNKKQSNYITNLTGKDLRLELCDDSYDSVVEVIDITEENEHKTTSKHLQPNVSRTLVINKSNKPSVDRRTDLSSNAQVLFREHDGETPLDALRVAFETQAKQKSESSNTNQKQTQLHNDNSQKYKDTVETSLNTMLNNSDQNDNILKHIENDQVYDKKPKDISVQKSVDAMEVSLETILNGTNRQDTAINKPSLSGQLINEEIVEDVFKIAQSTVEVPPKTIIHKHDENGNQKMKIEQSNVKAQESINQILQETTKNSIELNVGIQIDAKPLNVSNIQENLLQSSEIYIAPLCRSDKTFKEQAQTFEDTFNKVAKKPIDDIEKSTQNGLENSTIETLETVNSSLTQNNEAESETLQISEQTIQTSSNTTIVTTKLEQKTDSRIQSNMSDKYVDKKPKSLETSELITSEESREKTHTRWSRIEYKTDGTTNEVTVPHKHIEDTSEEKSEVVTNTKKVDNKCLVPDERKNKDQTKSNEQEKQLSPRLRHYILRLELGMSKCLQKDYTITSIVNVGRCSTIYKCIDTEGGAYALKVVRERPKGKFIKGIFNQIERFRAKQDSCILYMMNAFEFQKQQWCFLTEYFSENLKQVLDENKRGFHIDQVQVLSRQLVDAVNTVARAGIIHTDIKPKHILLNSAQDRLKLCGFDRSSYLNGIKVTPSTGSTKYRAPEVILGFQENQNHMIFAAMDVWSTGLVIFEMATNKSLFNASYNNGLLYEQLCTFGSFDWTMVQKSKYSYLYFSGSRFIRRLWPNGHQKIMMKDILERNDNLREKLFDSYNQYWTQNKSKWQITKEMDKLETLHTLLQQMLELDPRHRLPIEFVNASEFMTHTLTTA